MFVHPGQVADIAKRFPQVQRARLVVSGEMANDQMALRVETLETAPGLVQLLQTPCAKSPSCAVRWRFASQGACPTTARSIEAPAATTKASAPNKKPTFPGRFFSELLALKNQCFLHYLRAESIIYSAQIATIF